MRSLGLVLFGERTLTSARFRWPTITAIPRECGPESFTNTILLAQAEEHLRMAVTVLVS